MQVGIVSPVTTATERLQLELDLDAAASVLRDGVSSGSVNAASMYVSHRGKNHSLAFGDAKSSNAVFLLASITKPMAIAAVMSLAEQGLFKLDDRVCDLIPEFTGDGREEMTMRNLMTHVSGLPDQLPNNVQLRAGQADLGQFVQGAIRTPLLFQPGSRYRYSSMGILLACEVAQRLSEKTIAELVHEVVFGPLKMHHSALGLGAMEFDSVMPCQVESAVAEAGAGDPASKSWDWNSPYWRRLGSPWGGAHASAVDVVKFLRAFSHPPDRFLKPGTVAEMIRNHNPRGLRRRGLGFDLGRSVGGPHVSEHVFGHGGSTGTLCWADPDTDTVVVVLTTLPVSTMRPHPREAVSDLIASSIC